MKKTIASVKDLTKLLEKRKFWGNISAFVLGKRMHIMGYLLSEKERKVIDISNVLFSERELDLFLCQYSFHQKAHVLNAIEWRRDADVIEKICEKMIPNPAKSILDSLKSNKVILMQKEKIKERQKELDKLYPEVPAAPKERYNPANDEAREELVNATGAFLSDLMGSWEDKVKLDEIIALVKKSK